MSRTTASLALGTAALTMGLAAPAFAFSIPSASQALAQPTSLTLKAAKSTVAPRQKDTLTGTLKSGNKALAGQSVSLLERAPGAKHWSVVTTKTTDSLGHVALTVTPGRRKGQKEQYEVLFKGTSSYKGSHSSVITVTVS